MDDFRRQLEVNLVGPLAITQALLPLLGRAQGRVVNVTSAAGKAGVPLMAPYVAAKHRLEGLSDVMRLEFGLLGIKVAVVEPGFIGTAMGGKLRSDTEPRCTPCPKRAGAGTALHCPRWPRRSASTRRLVHHQKWWPMRCWMR